MTNVALALPVLGLFLLQTPERAGSLGAGAPDLDLSPVGSTGSIPGRSGREGIRQALRTGTGAAARQALANQKPGRKIVCGMVVIEADPGIDPKILVPPPADSATSKIRRIVPPTCTE